MFMTRTLAAVALSLAAVSPTFAADPNPKSLAVPTDAAATAADLVKHLADRDYHGREEATKELRKLGRLALPALLDAVATCNNAEVRLRCDILLPAAQSADIRARVDCFLADTEGKYEHDLPGAKRFFAAVSRSDVAKQLFGDLLRSPNRDMLIAVDGPEADLAQKFADRKTELKISPTGAFVSGPGGHPGSATNTDLAALVFAEACLPDRGIGVGVAGRNMVLMNNYQFQNSYRAAMDSDSRKEAFTAVLNHWMDTRTQPQSIYAAVNMANRYTSPMALPAARKLASGKVAGGPGLYRGMAAAYVARFGTKDDLAVIEPMLEDKGVLTNMFLGGVGNKRQVIQVRDLGLAMCLLMTKQEPADYGITFRYKNNGTNDSLKYQYSAYHFEAETEEKADEKRDAAVKKFKEWQAAQKKDDKKEEKKDDKQPEKK